MLIISNNPEVWKKFPNVYKVHGTPLEVMLEVKRRIYDGHKLVGMPISGNLRMIVSPYRSVLLSLSADPEIDNQSVMLVENAVERLGKTEFNSVPSFTLKDYSYMDQEFLNSALNEVS